MLDMSLKAQAYTYGVDRVAYDQDELLRLALIHIFQTIGEAAAHVSPGFQAAHPEIPWHEVIGMRNRLVHDYMNVDEDVVWEVVQQDLAPLIQALMAAMPPDD
jgi:uncharacterized protein with HEPN domain